MGQVFLATRTGPGFEQKAAVKVLWSVHAQEEVRARFLRERRLLASLDHPGLARFVDGGFMKDGRPWFAMEYVAGKPIDAHARGLGLRERLELFIEVCSSVAYAHQRLIVHRDIKPPNVLVDDTGRARLLDFGIAGVLEDIDDGVQTQTGAGPLTLQYASPEQVNGSVVTTSSDIYQLGLLLYELIAGARPYELHGSSLMMAMEVIGDRTPAKPSTRNPDVGPDLDAIVMSALAKDPDARYRSVAALAEDVRRFLEGLPVRAVPPSAWYLTQRFMRRHAALVAIVAASAVGLTATTLISVHMAREATAQATRSQAAQKILTDVFMKADPFSGRGKSVTLAEALVRAKPDIEARVEEDPLLAWEVNRTLGQIYQELGLVEEEMEAFRSMLVAAQRLSRDSGDRRHLVAIAGIGNVLARTNPVEAVRHFDVHLPALPGSRQALEPWLTAQYAYVGALSRVQEDGRADAATFAMEKVMEQHEVDDPRTRGRLSQLLAGVARRANDAKAEERHRRETVEYMRAANNPSALAVTLSNHAIYVGRQGRFQESEDAFQEALSIFEEAGLQDPTYASVLRSYGGLLFRTGRAAEAIAATRRSLAIFQARYAAVRALRSRAEARAIHLRAGRRGRYTGSLVARASGRFRGLRRETIGAWAHASIVRADDGFCWRRGSRRGCARHEG